jgi:hypothetical protein
MLMSWRSFGPVLEIGGVLISLIQFVNLRMLAHGHIVLFILVMMLIEIELCGSGMLWVYDDYVRKKRRSVGVMIQELTIVITIA